MVRLPLFAFILLSACVEEKVPRGTVIEVRGDVACNGDSIGPGDEVFEGDEIRVEQGRAEIDVAGVGRLRVFSSTKLRLTGKARAQRVELAIGTVWALISRLGSDSFEIEGRNVVAGVRGTEFIVESRDDDDEVRVIHGEVEVSSTKLRNKARRVRGGERVRTSAQETPRETERYDHDGDRARWAELREASREIKEGFKKGGRAVRDNTRRVGRKIRDFFR